MNNNQEKISPRSLGQDGNINKAYAIFQERQALKKENNNGEK